MFVVDSICSHKYTACTRDYNVEQIFITKQQLNNIYYILVWNCDFNFNFKNLL
jgi:hypothetical protein